MLTFGVALPALAQDPVPALSFKADFEAPAYQLGNIHGQQGWVVDQGRADILPERGLAGSAGLVLRPVLPFTQARLSQEGKRPVLPVSFLELQILPVASDLHEKAELLDINSARIGVFRASAAAEASVWVFDGDGKGGGSWLESPVRIAVDPATGLAREWQRLNVREDVKRQTWDLWLNGVWVAADLGFQEGRPAEAATCIIMGDRKEPMALDDLSVSSHNPLVEDQDGDGLADALEVKFGFDVARDDRDEDANNNGVSNLDEIVKAAGKPEAEPLMAARRVVAAPEWSVPVGLVDQPFTLEIHTASPGAVIFYTLDGSDPTRSTSGAGQWSGGLQISRSSIIRAAARDAGGRWSAVVSGAWIFPDQVPGQTRPEGWPETFIDQSRNNTATEWTVPYGMGGKLPAAAEITAALRKAPTVVLIADPVALMGQKEGLYSNASQSGGRKLEGITVQVSGDGPSTVSTASLSLSGSSSRSHDVTLKHSLRLRLDEPDGAAHQLPGQGTAVLLRHPTHDSWTVASRWSRLRSSARYFSDNLADAWLASRGHAHLERRWVQVYLNEIYWGLYEAVEQTVPDRTGTTLLEGGALGVASPIFGSDAAWKKLVADARVLSVRSNRGQDVAGEWQALLTRLDAANLIDYIALNLRLSNQDWPIRNYLIEEESGRFRFLSWDAEWVMPAADRGPAVNLAAVMEAGDGPAALFSLLCDSAAFRSIVTDRLREEQGFSDEAFARQVKQSAEGVRPLLAAEAARWGTPDQPDEDFMARWENNVVWILEKWIPGRASAVRQIMAERLQNVATSQVRAAREGIGPSNASVIATEPVPFDEAVPPVISDRDGDGLPDEWEIQHGLNPDDPSDASADPDGDGLSNLEEFRRRRNPHLKDAPQTPKQPQTTGAFNRMEKPIVRKGRIVDRAQAEKMKLMLPDASLPAPAPAEVK